MKYKVTTSYDTDNPNIPDFTCTDCDKGFYYPHEGHFLDPHNEEAGRCIDCHVNNFKACADERCCA